MQEYYNILQHFFLCMHLNIMQNMTIKNVAVWFYMTCIKQTIARKSRKMDWLTKFGTIKDK